MTRRSSIEILKKIINTKSSWLLDYFQVMAALIVAVESMEQLERQEDDLK